MGSQNITWDIIYIFNDLILRRHGHLKIYIDFFSPYRRDGRQIYLITLIHLGCMHLKSLISGPNDG